MRRFKAFVVLFVITALGTFLSFEAIALVVDDQYLSMSNFGDVFVGYEPQYIRGATPGDMAAEDWKADKINAALGDVIPYVFIALVCFLAIGVWAGYRVYMNDRAY